MVFLFYILSGFISKSFTKKFFCLFVLFTFFWQLYFKMALCGKNSGDIKIGIYFGLSKIARDAKIGENDA